MRIVTNGLHDLLLPGLNYAVFGLGNKTYEHYNAMGIYVDKRLEELGGKRIHELGKISLHGWAKKFCQVLSTVL